jgi:hypothetical protein
MSIHDNFNGDPFCLTLIACIIDEKLLYIVKTANIYPKFTKLFLTHLKDVLYWANKYKIVEVFEFIKNLLTLRHSPIIKFFIANYAKGHVFKSNTYHVNDLIIKKINLQRFKSFFDILDNSPEIDIEIFTNCPNQKIYSHFLWIHTESKNHTYVLKHQALTNNEFYNSMQDIVKLLPEELGAMLMANLYVLNQNA